MSACIIPFENDFDRFGIASLNIVMVIVFTSSLSKLTKIPNWVLVVPVAFALYKAFCLDTLFFNKENTGIVTGVVSKISE
jgi:hypothetical protein